MADTRTSVAEMPGLYGPYTMHERVVQKIWLQRDYDQRQARLTDGRRLEVRSPGRWNLLGGPDFHEARLLFDGLMIAGDVEVHFNVSDWSAHRHVEDPAYAKVVLHVVLFPPPGDAPVAQHADGREIPTLVLLPLLHRDLEEYASDDALEAITSRNEWRFFAELAARPFSDLQALLIAKAWERWTQKVYFAGLRLEQLGWTRALHSTALEILGYRFNRTGMLAVAEKYPLADWAGAVDPESVFVEFQSYWNLQGTRPANHPAARLRQYQAWVTFAPKWPDEIGRCFPPLVDRAEFGSVRRVREAGGLRAFRNHVAVSFFDHAIGGTRLDNLVCDGFLPFLAARGEADYFPLWFHWFLGDVPDQVRRIMGKLGLADGQMQPLCHGYARGLLAWFIDREARASG